MIQWDRTTELQDAYGRFTDLPADKVSECNLEQIRRVEQLSDAYHLTFGQQDVMVSYLLKLTRKNA